MSDNLFQFTEVQMHKPIDNLLAALGILQCALLATDHGWNADIVLGVNQFQHTQPLQAALALLMPLTGPLDETRWETEDKT